MFTKNEEIKATVGAQFHCATPGGLAANASRSLAALLLASAALLFAPQAALADECGATDGDPGTADTVTCDQDDYPFIDYTADGDLTVDVVGGGADPVEFTDGDSATPGIDLDATGSDALTLNVDVGLDDPDSDHVLGLTTATGLLTVNVGAQIEAGDGGVIRTNAGGDARINILAGGKLVDFDNLAVDMTAAAGTTTTLNVQAQIGVAPGTVSSSNPMPNEDVTALRGAGSGAIVINNQSEIYGRFDFAGNDGGVTLNNMGEGTGWYFAGTSAFGGGSDTINNAAGALLLPSSGGEVSAQPGLTGGQMPEQLRETTVAFGDGNDVFNNAGTLLIGDARFTFADRGGPFGVEPPVGNVRPEVGTSGSGEVGSDVRFEELETFNNSGLIVLGGWVHQGSSHSGGELSSRERSDDIDGIPGHRFYIGNDSGEAICRQILTGEGLENPPANGFPCTDLTLVGVLLETQQTILRDTDRLTNDVLAMPGTDFVGSSDSAILLDAMFNRGQAQTSCQGRAGEDDFYRLPAADCVDLRGGSTADSTQIVVRDVTSGDRGAHIPEGIVIVDVAGGTSAAEHFTLSPASDGYTTLAGGAIDKGLFLFPLVYDEANQQHKLVSVLSGQAFQLPLLVQAAQDTTRAATVSAIERQGRVRAGLRSGSAPRGGFWGHADHGSIEREARRDIVSAAGRDLANNDFDQDTTTLTLGRDFLLGASDGSAWLAGGSLGYIHSDLAFDRSADTSAFEGVSAGLHGGYQAGAWYIDAALNTAWLEVDYDAPRLDLFPDGTIMSTDAMMLGARVDSGWHLRLTDAVSVEPLASLSWVRGDFDEMHVPSDDPLEPGNRVFGSNTPTSLRGGLGARLGLDTEMGGVSVQYRLTGRVWEEFDGETDVLIQTTGADATVSHEFDGAFTEVAAGVSLAGPGGAVSGFLDAQGTFGDDYESVGIEAGFRYQW